MKIESFSRINSDKFILAMSFPVSRNDALEKLTKICRFIYFIVKISRKNQYVLLFLDLLNSY